MRIRNRTHDEIEMTEEYVKEILGIPENYCMLCIARVGYPGEKKGPHSDEVFEWKM